MKLRADRDSSGSLDRSIALAHLHTHTHHTSYVLAQDRIWLGRQCWKLGQFSFSLNSAARRNNSCPRCYLSRTVNAVLNDIWSLGRTAKRCRCRSIDVYLRANDGCAWTSSPPLPTPRVTSRGGLWESCARTDIFFPAARWDRAGCRFFGRGIFSAWILCVIIGDSFCVMRSFLRMFKIFIPLDQW